MSNSLPPFVNPWLLFRHHETVSGLLDVAQMPYLQQSQNRQEGSVRASLSVEKRDDGRIVLNGSAQAELSLECQRCMQPFCDEYVADFEMVLVKYERQLNDINEEDDALVVEEQLELAPLIEQELILALPMIAKHDDCQAHYKNVENDNAETQQPFANLKDLLN